jgi:hypothetical protein
MDRTFQHDEWVIRVLDVAPAGNTAGASKSTSKPNAAAYQTKTDRVTALNSRVTQFEKTFQMLKSAGEERDEFSGKLKELQSKIEVVRGKIDTRPSSAKETKAFFIDLKNRIDGIGNLIFTTGAELRVYPRSYLCLAELSHHQPDRCPA